MSIGAFYRQAFAGLVICCCLAGWCTLSWADGSAAKTKSKKGSQGIQARALAPLLKSKSEPLWEKGISKVSADSLDDDKIVDLIAQFVNRESRSAQYSTTLGKAIELLGQAEQPLAAQVLAPLIKSDDFRIAMIAADAASRSSNPELFEPTARLAERPEFDQHYGFRRRVVAAVSHYREKAAIDFLIKYLAATDGQLKFEIAMALQRMTGQDFGGKAGDWQRWWTANRNEFELTAVTQPLNDDPLEPPRPIAWDEPRPRFYGITIYAKRVVFVIDRSGSMNASVNGITRLQRAQYEIQQAIQALSENDSFNVVAFDHEMDVFSRRMLPASEANKQDGIQFALALVPRGDTACYEPLKMALEASNELEMIMFVSDGEPTSGALTDPNAIVTAITNFNLTQRTTINTLGIDARGSHETFLKNLAGKNGGKLLVVR